MRALYIFFAAIFLISSLANAESKYPKSTKEKRKPMKVFLLAASLRKDSLNQKLISICNKHFSEHDVNLRQFSEFDVPLYNGDIEQNEGIPENATKFANYLKEADKIIFAVPEYNYSTPGTFKNLIDWTSRIRPMPFKDLEILIISASPSASGGHRGFLHTKVPLEGCGAFVYPGTFSLSNAHQAFKENGELIDKKLEKDLHKLLDEFIAK